MASEYALQLKATLDASDVQQKLGQLKQQQQSGQGGVGGGGVQQALQRLNTTLTNLQRSIDKLAAQQGKQTGSSPAAKGTPVVFGNAMRPAVSRPAPAAKVSPMAFGADLRQMQREMIGAFGLRDKYGPARQMEPILREWRGFQRHGWTGRKLWNRLEAYDDYSAVENWQAQQGSADAF